MKERSEVRGQVGGRGYGVRDSMGSVHPFVCLIFPPSEAEGVRQDLKPIPTTPSSGRHIPAL